MAFINSQYYVMAPCQKTTYHGPFDSSAEACEWANKQQLRGFRVRDGQYMAYLMRDHHQVDSNPTDYQYAIVSV